MKANKEKKQTKPFCFPSPIPGLWVSKGVERLVEPSTAPVCAIAEMQGMFPGWLGARLGTALSPVLGHCQLQAQASAGKC